MASFGLTPRDCEILPWAVAFPEERLAAFRAGSWYFTETRDCNPQQALLWRKTITVPSSTIILLTATKH